MARTFLSYQSDVIHSTTKYKEEVNMNTLLAQPIHPIQCKNNQRGSVNNTGSRANVQPSKQSPKSNASQQF